MNNTAAPECAAHNPTTTIPAGWKLVPVDPSARMFAGGFSANEKQYSSDPLDDIVQRTLETYKAMLSAAPQAPVNGSWQPIETAPKDGSWIMLWKPRTKKGFISKRTVSHGMPYIGRWDDGYKSWFYQPSNNRNNLPTHWMPLPSAPQPDLKGEG